ncbi:tetratricopeptide repeat protein [Nocardia cyriacigeorgica]|uniref:tetratricopeptide repeat protein n=1 Tax=Nocardia cyriacigeorgica TaxID=135487 RepID=UPI002457C559|nr:hypothetical protein [Nocardia cyriacigeorgica]
MIEPVTSTVAPATGTPSPAGPELPLAARYRSADPISWGGSMVYPMYTEQLTGSATNLTLTLLSATPPPGLRGLGMGLSMVDGYVGVDRRRLAGVDVWRDALERGITVELSAAGRGALYSLTPVWRDADGTARSWSGNYGIVVERAAGGRIVLWCSLGAGPPHFGDLVVEVSAAPADTTPMPAVGGGPARTVRTGEPRPPSTASGPLRPQPRAARTGSTAAPLDRPSESTADTGPAPNEPGAAAERDYRSALYDLGVAMFARGEEEQACELWSQAAAGGHGAAAYDLGVVRFRQGEFDEAERCWRIAAEQRGVRAMAGLAELLERRGATTEAQLWRTRAITAKTVAESLSRRAV